MSIHFGASLERGVSESEKKINEWGTVCPMDQSKNCVDVALHFYSPHSFFFDRSLLCGQSRLMRLL